MLNKTSVANVIAGAVVLAGIISVFFQDVPNDLMKTMLMIALGYLFGANVPNRLNNNAPR